MNGPSTLSGIPHHAAGRLAAHAAALEPAHHPAFTAHHPQHQARASPAPDVTNWAADFGRFKNQGPRQEPLQNGFPPPAHQMQMGQPPSQMNFQAAFAQPNNGFSPLYGPTNGGFMDFNAALSQRPGAEADFDQEMSQWMASHGSNRRMEDVDAVMDQMARELELNDALLSENEKVTQGQDLAQDRLSEAAETTNLETPPIENLSIRESDVTPATEKPENPKAKSEVAEAAERLLESVQNEDGEKWKNSVFLSLMRDFRDGKKDIVDNEIRETTETENTTQAAN